MGRPSRRTCVGCRTARERRTLIRLHADTAGRVVLSRPGAAGRGAYLCPSAECLARALARGGFARALRRSSVLADPEALTALVLREVDRRFSRDPGERSA